MQVLPKTLIKPIRQYFATPDQLAIFLTITSITTNNLTNIEYSEGETKVKKKSKKKSIEDGIDKEVEIEEEVEVKSVAQIKGIYSKEYFDGARNDYVAILEEAAQHWVKHGAKQLKNVEAITIKFDLPSISKQQFQAGYRIYLNYLAKN